MHSEAPTRMTHIVLAHAMRKKVCYAEFDDEHKMIDGTEVLAEPSDDEEETDEEYKAVMMQRRKVISPKKERVSPPSKREDKKRRRRTRRESSPSRADRRRGGVWSSPVDAPDDERCAGGESSGGEEGRTSASSNPVSRLLSECWMAAGMAQHAVDDALKQVDDLKDKLGELSDAVEDAKFR